MSPDLKNETYMLSFFKVFPQKPEEIVCLVNNGIVFSYYYL